MSGWNQYPSGPMNAYHVAQSLLLLRKEIDPPSLICVRLWDLFAHLHRCVYVSVFPQIWWLCPDEIPNWDSHTISHWSSQTVMYCLHASVSVFELTLLDTLYFCLCLDAVTGSHWRCKLQCIVISFSCRVLPFTQPPYQSCFCSLCLVLNSWSRVGVKASINDCTLLWFLWVQITSSFVMCLQTVPTVAIWDVSCLLMQPTHLSAQYSMLYSAGCFQVALVCLVRAVQKSLPFLEVKSYFGTWHIPLKRA